ncbi:MAG: tetratricopeptide repeat protein [Magnetococcus sp. DMHC-1]|nr:tetratricopeptide repeat protein [Magnetococcales bacterium]
MADPSPIWLIQQDEPCGDGKKKMVSDTSTLFAQAMGLQQQGDLARAEAIYQHILACVPRHYPSLRNLGLLYLDQDKTDLGIDHLEQALLQNPADTPIRFMLANTLMGLCRMEAAARHFQAILHRDPTHAAATYHLGLTLHALGDVAAAITTLQRALQLPGADREHILASLGMALRSADQPRDAEICYREILAREPNNPHIRNTLALLLQKMGRIEEARQEFETTLAAAPNLAMTWNNLAILCREQGQYEQAEHHYRTALRLDPNFFEAWNNLAIVLGDMGCAREAVEIYRQALAINPASARTHSNLIMNLHYLPESTAATLLAECRRFNQQHVAPLAGQLPPPTPDPDPERPLRIGYLSVDFKHHPVGFFWQPVMAAHDKNQFEIFCYSGVLKSDWVTQRLQGWADHWQPVREMDNLSLAHRIRRDGIDILVELGGHTEGNRLPLLGYRPAPIQMTAGGHFSTTGLEVIDYLVCDRFHAPPGTENEFSETPLRLPDGYICYAPPYYAPPVTDLPALATGYITFGCFNNQMKITPEVVALWAQILHRVPTARLVMHTRGFDDQKTRERYLEWFRLQAIDASRLELGGLLSHQNLLAAYGGMDVALDPFPYSGGLTTLEALWMGVPVVTLQGGYFCGRHSSSHLHNVDLAWLVTRSPEEYVETAVKLTNNLEELARLRHNLRVRMGRSPLCDGSRYTRNLETAYREVWRHWCANTQITSV